MFVFGLVIGQVAAILINIRVCLFGKSNDGKWDCGSAGGTRQAHGMSEDVLTHNVCSN